MCACVLDERSDKIKIVTYVRLTDAHLQLVQWIFQKYIAVLKFSLYVFIFCFCFWWSKREHDSCEIMYIDVVTVTIALNPNINLLLVGGKQEIYAWNENHCYRCTQRSLCKFQEWSRAHIFCTNRLHAVSNQRNCILWGAENRPNWNEFIYFHILCSNQNKYVSLQSFSLHNSACIAWMILLNCLHLFPIRFVDVLAPTHGCVRVFVIRSVKDMKVS